MMKFLNLTKSSQKKFSTHESSYNFFNQLPLNEVEKILTPSEKNVAEELENNGAAEVINLLIQRPR
jgi:hypothetical protein